ncbi:class I tRNA ligase family protein, partial [Lacticaseibacillus paracasei]
VKEAFENFQLRKATQLIMELASLCNVYFYEMKPWQLAKTEPERMKNVLACCVFGIKLLAIAAYPIIPEASEKVWKM